MRERRHDQQHEFRSGAERQDPHGDAQRGPWSGQIVMGPSFYVWDESPRQAREWGVELANAWLARQRRQR